jgi:hypothetical protein
VTDGLHAAGLVNAFHTPETPPSTANCTCAWRWCLACGLVLFFFALRLLGQTRDNPRLCAATRSCLCLEYGTCSFFRVSERSVMRQATWLFFRSLMQVKASDSLPLKTKRKPQLSSSRLIRNRTYIESVISSTKKTKKVFYLCSKKKEKRVS